METHEVYSQSINKTDTKTTKANYQATGRSRNQSLNFLKGIGCIGVVFIHVAFPRRVGQIISEMSQFAVPIFLMIAGYYAFGCSESTIKRRLIKILKIFIYGYLSFLAYNAASQIKSGTLVEWFKANYTIKSLIKYVVFCNIDFAIPLWYLIAMIETYILWYYVVKYKKESVFVNLIPIIFLFYIVLTTICETNDFAWFWKTNFVSRALSWFLFGYYVHNNEKNIVEKTSNISLIIGAMIGCIIALIPIIFDVSINFSCIGRLFYSTSLFMIAIKNPNKIICKPIAYLGDELSLNIYIFHVIIAGIIVFAFGHIFKIDVESNLFSWIKPILTVVATIMLSSVLYYGKRYICSRDIKN
jgi:surface polysaccharide O-acyltransferase-like enzyme